MKLVSVKKKIYDNVWVRTLGASMKTTYEVQDHVQHKLRK